MGRAKGFTLIELLIGMGIIAILALLAAPSLRSYGLNNKIRAQAESLSAELQQARTDAISRNATVEFMFTGATDFSNPDNVTPAATGTNWFTRTADTSATPPHTNVALRSRLGIESGAANGVVQVQTAGASDTTAAAVKSIFFLPLGQSMINATSGTGSLSEGAIINVTNPAGGNCESDASPGAMRCLRVLVSVSGQVRVCDPKAIAANGDSRAC